MKKIYYIIIILLLTTLILFTNYKVLKGNQENTNSKKIVLKLNHDDTKALDYKDTEAIVLENKITDMKFDLKEEIDYHFYDKEKYYDNLKIFLDYIQNNFNIEINNKWKVQINKISNDYGLVRFVYYINGYISTNKAITFSVNDKKVEKVYYSFINENLDESVIINKVKKFKNNIVQEKKKLNKDETLIEEKTTYDYNYRTNKITYTYCLYFQNGYGIVNNDYCSIYFLH